MALCKIANLVLNCIDLDQQPIPSTGAYRAIYVGEIGAWNWLRAIGEPGYRLRAPECFPLQTCRLEALHGMHVKTLVSLGPGDGLYDIDLATALQAQSRLLSDTVEPKQVFNAIPVDVSWVVLQLACRNLQPHVTIPVGAMCDFEDGQGFLVDTLTEYALPLVLFSMLGGTIENLDEQFGGTELARRVDFGHSTRRRVFLWFDSMI